VPSRPYIYGHMICLLKLPCYLYLDPIVYLDVMDQMFKCTGNYFLFGALITIKFDTNWGPLLLITFFGSPTSLNTCSHNF